MKFKCNVAMTTSTSSVGDKLHQIPPWRQIRRGHLESPLLYPVGTLSGGRPEGSGAAGYNSPLAAEARVSVVGCHGTCNVGLADVWNHLESGFG